jgi:hypothetical protein
MYSEVLPLVCETYKNKCLVGPYDIDELLVGWWFRQEDLVRTWCVMHLCDTWWLGNGRGSQGLFPPFNLSCLDLVQIALNGLTDPVDREGMPRFSKRVLDFLRDVLETRERICPGVHERNAVRW